jgi:ribosomal protein L37E
MSLKRESYIELQIENKILKNKIEVLEQQLQNINLKDYNFSLVEDALLNVENNLQKNYKKIIKPYNNKLSTSAYEIHSSNLKITFKFACCNKDYDCLDCHNTSEQHSGTKPICINCLECMHTSYNINDTICYYCGISFAKEKDENVKLEVIKYKNFNKKNIRPSNEETSQKRKNLKTQKTEKFEKIERIENRKKNIKI